MKRLFILFSVIASFALIGFSSAKACENKNDVPLTSLTSGFDAWKVVTSAMEECGNYTPTLDQEYKDKIVAALDSNPSQYSLAGVSASTNVAVLDAGLTRPLDDLIAKHGGALQDNQKVTINGQVMAIAMMTNAQHLFYREDIFNDLGIDVPTTYDEVIKAAKVIQNAGVVDYPLGATFKVGWNLGEEFVNMYLGYADTFFDGNMPAVNNANGYETLKMLKKLTEYMDPEYLNSDSTYVQQQFQQGKIAMANLWASRAGAMDNAEESSVVGLVKFASAPSAKKGGKPASTLWWDGVVIAKNISDEEAEAAFKLAMVGLDPANLGASPEAAPWISNAFDPAPSNIGAVMTAKGGAAPYPASAQMSTLHGVLGNVLPDYLTGAATAKATLEKIEADYITAATEKGLL